MNVVGTRLPWVTPGGLATDLTILASTLLTLAGLLFLFYVVFFLAGLAWGTVAGPERGDRAGRASDGGRRR